MPRNAEHDALREQLETYLLQENIPVGKPFRCLNPAHEDRNPSMSFDRKNHRVHCFSCGATYDLFDLVGLRYGLSTFPEKLAKAQALLGVAPRVSPAKKPKAAPALDVPAYVKRAQACIAQTDYPARRGLSEETVRAFGLGFDAGYTRSVGRPWQALIIPTGPDSFTARNTDPAADSASRVRKVGPVPLYNGQALAGDAPVFIVEGELDALSLLDVGAQAVGLGGVSGAGRLLAALAEQRPKGGVILCLDADESGQKAAAAIAEGCRALSLHHTAATLPAGSKDPNDALLLGREAFAVWAQDTIAQHRHEADAERRLAEAAYRRTNVQGYLQHFVDGIAAGVDTPCVPTGFDQLDRALDGGLYEGLYIFGAITSLGKTTFVLQMADQIAAAGQDVLIFSLEMARTELMAKSISRQTLKACLAQGLPVKHAKTSRGITDSRRYARYGQQDRQIIRDAIAAYHDIAACVYIHEGVGDIGTQQVRQVVRNHIDITGRKPVVIIDYLQIMAPEDPRATDKQSTDKTVLELKRISRDDKLPVIGISSFNRENYKNAVSMVAFKESGAIEYSSDVLIGLQLKGVGGNNFDAEEAKKKDPRDISLRVLKNRNGSVGGEVDFAYYPMFNYFQECGQKGGL